MLLEVSHLKQYFPVLGSKQVVKAVDDVSFFIKKGETFGLVGESASQRGNSPTRMILNTRIMPHRRSSSIAPTRKSSPAITITAMSPPAIAAVIRMESTSGSASMTTRRIRCAHSFLKG